MDKHQESPRPQPNLPARTIRHDGWTAERQEAFLLAFASSGIISAACRAVGMSRQSLRDLCARPSAAAFRRAFDAARDCAFALVEDGAIERSINGVRRPIFYHGEKVGEWREYDERLTMFLLRYRRHHRFGSQLDRLPPPPAPIQPPGCEFEEPDEDEAMGRLDWHLDDLADVGDPPDLTVFSKAGRIDNFDNFVGNGCGPDDDDRHPGPEPGSAFSWGEEDGRVPGQARHDDDCDDSGASLDPRA